MSRQVSGSLLILRLSAFGDVLHTLPAVLLLRQALPAIRLGWVVEEPYRELIELVAPVDEVFTVATRRWRREPFHGRTWRDFVSLRRNLMEFSRRGSSIDFQGLIKSAVLGKVAEARERYGFDRSVIRERASRLFINCPLPVNAAQHVIEMNADLVRTLTGTAFPTPGVDLRPFESDGGGRLQGLADGKILLNPGAGHPSKRWPAGHFAQLARKIEAELGLASLVLWGPGERSLGEEIVSTSGAQLAPETNLRELAFLVAHARALVSSDSGPLHLAAGLETAVVGLYGPTHPVRNGPWGQLERVVRPAKGNEMNAISVKAVLQKLKEIL